MRTALLVLTIVAALSPTLSNARATFKRFETPEEGRRCTCVGAANCSEMQKSDSCKSGPICDHSELGAIICSCKAAGPPRRIVERSKHLCFIRFGCIGATRAARCG